MLAVAIAALQLFSGYLVSGFLASRLSERIAFGGLTFLLQIGLLCTTLSLFQALAFRPYLASAVILAVLLICTSVVCKKRDRKAGDTPRHTFGGFAELTFAGWAGLSILFAASGVGLLWAIRIPINDGDVVMYHASRCLYWLQNQSILHFDTHNDRQVAFPFNADLVLLQGFLLGKSEWPARIIHFLGFLFSLVAIYALGRRMGISRVRSIWACVLVTGIPVVLAQSYTQKPELWLTFAVATTLCAFLRSLEKDARCSDFLSLGAGTVLCYGLKSTGVLIVLLLPLSILFAKNLAIFKRTLFMSVGLTTAAVASGPLLNTWENVRVFGHPFGPAKMLEVHRADLGPKQLLVHATRLFLFSLEYPFAIEVEAKKQFEARLNALSKALGASTPLENPNGLASERPGSWPGSFVITTGTESARFSLFFAPLVGAVFILALSGHSRYLPPTRPIGSRIVAGFTIVYICFVSFYLRWQIIALSPERFLVPALALAAICVLAIAPMMSKRPALVTVGALSLGIALVPAIQLGVQNALLAVYAPETIYPRSVFWELPTRLRPGERVLLFSSQGAGDYVLFRAEHRFDVSVIPWGKHEFDKDRLQSLLDSHDVSTVIIENDQTVSFHWAPPLRTESFVKYFSQAPQFARVPLSTPNMVFFQRDN